MLFQISADLVVIVHLLFILFVLFGSLLALYGRWVIWVHVPVVLWGIGIEVIEWVCPLTPLENRLRISAGQEGYAGGFVEHYLLSVIYPDGLTREVQLLLGCTVLLINAVLYGFVVIRKRNS